MTLYKVPIIGDGKSTETAFRPDIPKGLVWGAWHIEADAGVCVIEVPDHDKTDLSASPVERIDVPAGVDKVSAVEAAVADIVAAANVAASEADPTPIP